MAIHTTPSRELNRRSNAVWRDISIGIKNGRRPVWNRHLDYNWKIVPKQNEDGIYHTPNSCAMHPAEDYIDLMSDMYGVQKDNVEPEFSKRYLMKLKVRTIH